MSVDVMFNTRANPWRKARFVNATNTSFPSKIPTATDPYIAAGVNGDANTATGGSIIRLTDQETGGVAQNGIRLMFFGAGADTNTFSCRVIGWSCGTSDRLSPVTPDTNIWFPTVLVEVSCALSLQTGVANRFLPTTDLFCDTVTVVGTTGGTAGIDYKIRSPANDTIADMFVDLWGAQAVELTFDMTGATSGNALYMLF